MNQETFLWRLMERLSALEPGEREQVAAYYQELILDGIESGKAEEDVVAGFGDPADVARQILAERSSLQEKEEKIRRELTRQRQGELREYRAKGDVDTVFIQTRNRRVDVRESTDGAVRVWFAAGEGDRVNVENANGAFRFIHKASFFGDSWFFWTQGHREVIVELPHGFTGKAYVQTTNSRIGAQQMTVPGQLQLRSSNGKVAVSDSEIGVLQTSTSNGSVSLENITGTACEAATSNGAIHAKLCGMEQHLWLESSNGAIHPEQIAAPDLSFTTSNGAIRGTVAGKEEEYNILVKTSNGRANLDDVQEEHRPNRLRAITTNGSIHIEFTDAPAP